MSKILLEELEYKVGTHWPKSHLVCLNVVLMLKFKDFIRSDDQ